MTYPTGIKTKAGRTPDERIVLFHGSPIGTVKRFETAKPIRASQRVVWAIYIYDEYNSIGWCSTTLDSALRRIRRLYMEQTGSSSSRHNHWVSRIRARIESPTRMKGVSE